MKNIIARALWFRFPVKLICFIAFGSTSGACYLPKSVGIIR